MALPAPSPHTPAQVAVRHLKPEPPTPTHSTDPWAPSKHVCFSLSSAAGFSCPKGSIFERLGYIGPGSSVHGFSRQEDWSGLPFPTPGDLPDSGIQLVSPALQADFFTAEPPWIPSTFLWKEGILCPLGTTFPPSHSLPFPCHAMNTHTAHTLQVH